MADEKTLRDQVANRAEHRCEYCQLPERSTSLPFQVDHIIAVAPGLKLDLVEADV